MADGFYQVWPPPPTGTGGGGGGVTSIGSMDAQAQSINGASVAGAVLFMQSASSSSGGAGVGLVNTVAQPFLGVKTFVSSPIISSLAVAAPLVTDVNGQVTNGSVSLTNQVSGALPLSQTVGSLTLAQMNLSVGGLDLAAANPNAATLGSNSLYLQSASASSPGIVNSTSQTFSGVKTFNGQILAPGGVGLGTISSGTIAMLSIGADANTKYVVIGSTSVTGFYPRLGIAMNNPQASIHFGSLNGNTNTTSGVVGSFSVVLGGLNATAAVGLGAFIAGGTGGLNTASGQDSCAIGYNDQASGIGAAAIGYANNASGNFSSSFGAAAHAAQDGSCTLGYTAQTTTSGGNQRAVAIGESATAQGNSAVAIGFHTNVTIAGQVALGNYNIPGIGSTAIALGSTDEVLVVGIGMAAGQNANVLSCTRDGAVRHYTSSGTAFVAIYVGTTTSYAITLPGTQASSSCVLTNNGGGSLAWTPASSSPGSALTTRTITSGTGTYTVPAGVRALKVTAVGAGGGGGGCSNSSGSTSSTAGGGCGGNTCLKWINTSSLSATYSYTVGDHGVRGNTGNNAGGAGANTTFGSVIDTLSNGGGSGAISTINGQFVAGGTITGGSPTGDVVIFGQPGGCGFSFPVVAATSTVLVSGFPGAGGGTFLSGGSSANSIGTIGTSQPGAAGTGFGSGGSGALSCGSGGFQAIGGNGSNGAIIIEEYY